MEEEVVWVEEDRRRFIGREVAMCGSSGGKDSGKDSGSSGGKDTGKDSGSSGGKESGKDSGSSGGKDSSGHKMLLDVLFGTRHSFRGVFPQ